MKAQKLDRRQACYVLYLLRSNFTLKYVPGTKIGKADRLSRRPDWKVGIEKDNKNQILIKEQQICSLTKVVIEGPKIDILEKVLRGEEWQIEGDLGLKEEKVYVPKDKKLRIEIIWLHHNILVVGHKERWKITELVIRNYWQSGVTRDMGRYVNKYGMCQRMKNGTKVLAKKLKLSKISEKQWIYLIVDFITKLLLVVGKNVILVIYDRLSKIMHFLAKIEEISVEGLVRLFRNNVWKLHRLPESIVLDRGPQFVAELIRKLNKILGIETKLLIFFHPQIDRQTE